MSASRARGTALTVLAMSAVCLGLMPAAWAGSSDEPLQPTVIRSVKHDVSLPLTVIVSQAEQKVGREGMRPIPNSMLPKSVLGEGLAAAADPVLQLAGSGPALPGPSISWEGINNRNGVLPPDTNGDVGPNHYVQWVNLSFAIYNKTTGQALLGPFNGNLLFYAFGGPCESTNDGDPIVLYDHLADRWFVSQFALPGFSGSGGFWQCMAVSATGDPMGAWYRYAFLYSNTLLNDYPHFGVWPDGYYMTVNQFGPPPSFPFAGAGSVVYERAQMLAGQPARAVMFNLQPANPCFGGMLPSDLDGPAPPAGTPNYFVEVDDTTGAPCNFPTDAIRVWNFSVNWVPDPPTATFGVALQPNNTVNVADFSYLPCTLSGSRDCIPQPGAAANQFLDAIGDRLMHRAQFRYFGTHSSIYMNHTVDAGSGRAGVRWYELRNPGGTPTIHQQGTYALADTTHRWMGSIAADAQGNIGLGFSASSASLFPSIHFTGRSVADPLNQMRDDGILITGSGIQTHTASRWGDYSMLSVDPTDDCTFYFTSEYITTTGSANWRTRVGASSVPGCTVAVAPNAGTLQGTVTSGGSPVAGVRVFAGAYERLTDAAGFYRFTNLPAGTYNMSTSKYGYSAGSAPGVVVSNGSTTTQNFTLTRTAFRRSGTITDGSGHGWGLYSRINITGGGYTGPNPVYSSPGGGYAFDLLPGGPYTITVTPLSAGSAGFPGYNAATQAGVTQPASDVTQNYQPTVDIAACSAPGYQPTGVVFNEAFTGTGGPPAGWSVVGGAGNTAWRFNSLTSTPCAFGSSTRTNLTGGTGNMAIADSDCAGTVAFDSQLISPVFNASAMSTVVVTFKSDFRWYSAAPSERGDLDVSADGGTTWTNVLRYENADFRGPRTVSVNVTPQLAGQANSRIRFHYYQSNYDWWWQVDDALVRSGCGVATGGLVAGLVFDNTTGRPITGALVAHNGTPPAQMNAAATPWDPVIPDAGYILFVPGSSAVTFTVSATGYTTQMASVTPVVDQIVRRDWLLN